jgi:glycosyltransferase involved in cell wall biosynthesis
MLSICIPTHNRAPWLKVCLTKLLSQIPNDWEVLVGDNNSGGGPAELTQANHGDV